MSGCWGVGGALHRLGWVLVLKLGACEEAKARYCRLPSKQTITHPL